MKYKIRALTIWEQGKYRENQEDAVFPALGTTTEQDRLFMVCDGMGGHEAGEVASNAVIEAISKRVLSDATPEGSFDDAILLNAISDAYDLLDERDPNPESLKRMGTTMTFLKLHEGGATVAHIGDSRIYQFRNVDGEMTVCFKSVDHSLVNDLVKVGEMTEEEARTSPLKNRLTRAMQARLENPPKADIAHISDIQPGDYFLLCSDGMIENADDQNLCFMLGCDRTDDEKLNMLIRNSDDNRDNHSAILVHILEVDGQKPASAVKSDEVSAVPVKEQGDTLSATAKPTIQTPGTSTIIRKQIRKSRRQTWFLMAIGILLLLMVVFLWLRLAGRHNPTAPDSTEPHPVVYPQSEPVRRQKEPAQPNSVSTPVVPPATTPATTPDAAPVTAPVQPQGEAPAATPAAPAKPVVPTNIPVKQEAEQTGTAEAVSDETQKKQVMEEVYKNNKPTSQTSTPQ